MKDPQLAAAALLAMALASAGCRDRPAAGPGAQDRNPAAVLGGYGPHGSRASPPAPSTDAHGRPVPRPNLPAAVHAQVVRSGDETALAVWEQDGRVLAAAYAPATGWSAARPLEQIHGEASDPRLASNGQGSAMAVWRHTVGNIQSLRFSRFDAASGWSEPDVLPGALPRPHAEGAAGDHDAPQLQMDAQGDVTAHWPSGFDAAEVQVARYTAGQGWSPAQGEPVAAASAASTPAALR